MRSFKLILHTWFPLLLAASIAVLSAPASAADAPPMSAAQTTATPADEPVAKQLLVMLNLPAAHFRPDVSYAGNYRNDAGSSARHRIAANLAQQYQLKMVEDWAMPALSIDCYLMEVSQDQSPESIASQLSQDSRVAWAQPIQPFQAMASADPLYPVQPVAKFWHLSDLHKLTHGRDVRIAVIDSGVDSSHPDLLGQVSLKENFIDGNPYAAEEHGTEVAGIIAAIAGNGLGIAGVAPEARLLALRACWQGAAGTACNSFTLGKAMNFAILKEAQIINLSLSGPTDKLLERLVQVALARGIVIVAAINPDIPNGGFPAAYPGVLAVSDSVAADKKNLVLIAPGSGIPTTAPDARWTLVSGTSFATAHVSGLVALIHQLRPTLTPAQLRNELSAQTAGPGNNLDACAVIQKISGQCACSCSP